MPSRTTLPLGVVEQATAIRLRRHPDLVVTLRVTMGFRLDLRVILHRPTIAAAPAMEERTGVHQCKQLEKRATNRLPGRQGQVRLGKP